MLINCLAVGAGGFLGSVGRYLLSAAFSPQNVSFPWITLLINFLGSFLIAAVSELPDNWLPLSPRLLLFLRMGICGGFTTFSTFSFETVRLFEDGKVLSGCGYAFLSVLLCLTGIVLGKLVIRFLRGLFHFS